MHPVVEDAVVGYILYELEYLHCTTCLSVLYKHIYAVSNLILRISVCKYYVFKPVPDTKLTTDKALCQRCGHILIGSIHNECIKSLHAFAIKTFPIQAW